MTTRTAQESPRANVLDALDRRQPTSFYWSLTLLITDALIYAIGAIASAITPNAAMLLAAPVRAAEGVMGQLIPALLSARISGDIAVAAALVRVALSERAATELTAAVPEGAR